MFSRILRIIAGVAILLIVSGATYQAAASRSDERKYPPPGQLVDAGGQQLHLLVKGNGGPTVILEAGLGGVAAQWARVQPEIAKHARVVAYDRAGMGWSDPSEQPYDATHAAERLHTALQNAGIKGPYILVGHSVGGHYMRVFADQHADEVIGMVLVDASHPDQFDRLSGLSMPTGRLERVSGLLARIGVMRLANPSQYFLPDDMPEELQTAIRNSMNSPKYWSALSAETAAWSDTEIQARQTGGLGELPLTVVTAIVDAPEGWQELQAELVELSTRGSQKVVEGADHISIVTDPEYSAVVAQTVIDMIDLTSTSVTRTR